MVVVVVVVVVVVDVVMVIVVVVTGGSGDGVHGVCAHDTRRAANLWRRLGRRVVGWV